VFCKVIDEIGVVIEKGEEVLCRGIEGNECFSPATAAETTKDVFANLKMLIKDYGVHEGRGDDFWGR